MTLDELSKIPDKWQISKVEDFCEVMMGQSPPSSTYNLNGDGLPFFQGRKDFGRKYPEKKMWCSESTRVADEGDVLLSVRAPVGDVNVAIERCCIGRGVSALSMKNGNKEFLYYLMQHNRQRLKQIFESEGTVFGCVNKDGLRNFEVLLPAEVSEQQAIAKVLSDLDEKIELNHQMIKTLESIAQALFKRWFVDFDFPDDCGKPYKSSGGKMSESEFSEIPAGWRIGKFSDLVSSVKSPLKPGVEIRDRKYVPIESLPMRRIGMIEYKSYLEAQSSLIAFEVGDILFGAMRAYFHRVNFAPFKGVTRTTTFVLRPREKTYLSFALFLLNLDSSVHYANLHSKGSTMPYAVWDNSLSEMPVVLPPTDQLNEYHCVVYPFLQMISRASEENIRLVQIRDYLLPELMSGEIRTFNK